MTSSVFNRFKDKCIDRYITVRGTYIGMHAYENAPDNVAFLRHLHRHLFKWEATIQVFHDDREVEFFTLQEEISKHILPFINQRLNLGSCEMQAERILEGLVNTYGADRIYHVTVSEDGESDGTVVWDAGN